MDILLFDLDNTLYPPERDLFRLIDVRINRYMVEIAGIPAKEVDYLRRDYWQRYGVTLQGLIRHHGVDPEDYLDYVHDIDVGARLLPDRRLRTILETLPQRKAVFTNGSAAHAGRVLEHLGIQDLFESIYDIRVAGYQPKPHQAPYRAVLAALDAEAGTCIMIEDTADNLRTAKQLGMYTVLVGPGETPSFVDLHIAEVSELGDRLCPLILSP